MGSHVYGCDICQEVCPYNRPAPHSEDRTWQPRPGLDAPRLIDLWRRSDRDLKALVKGGPMTRAKLSGLRRNIAVAIGNTGDESVIAVLDNGSDERPSANDPMVQEHVAWARGRLKDC
jgi:epoxyqueuosine reductase